MYHKIIILLTLCFSLHSSFGKNYDSYVSHELKDKTLRVDVEDGSYHFQFITPKIVRVYFQNEFIQGEEVYAPILKTKMHFKFRNEANYLILSSKDVTVKITKAPFSIAFLDDLSEKLNGLHFYSEGDSSGFRYKLTPNEKIFGTGSRALPMNRRGYRFQCYNQANYGYGMNTDFLNYSIPHIMSSKQYMMLYDNPARAWFDIGKRKTNSLEFSSLGGNASCYFIAGDTYNDLMERNTSLTGRQPLIPIWALGNIQSRFGYTSQAQTDSIVNAMIQNGYPLDAIVLDLYWFGEQMQNGVMGNLSWDKKHWPNPKKMIQDFKEKGVKTITISEPFFTRKCQHFTTLDEQGFLCTNADGKTMTMPYFYFGDAGLIDIFNPEARDWLWQQYDIQKQLGVAGWWGDLGEPEVHPDSMWHINGSAQKLHGLYGHEWTSLFYENYEKFHPNERLFMMGRAAFAGSQRYGLIPWSGDVSRTWSGLEAQVPIMLGTGISGLAYMHSDAGGFAQGTKSPELYTRWLQFASFTPIFRPHSDPNAEPEPIFYSDTVQNIVKRYIKLRYAMLPYNYTLSWEATKLGLPMARPIFTVYNNSAFADNDSTYLWGNQFLVAPIFQSHAETKRIFLPEGVWFDFWNSTRRFNGNQLIEEPIDLKDIPVFVKGGSFIPMAEAIFSTDDYSSQQLTVHYYHDPSIRKANYTLYLDDGKTKDAFKRKQYELIDFQFKDGVFKISNTGFAYSGRPSSRDIKLIIHNSSFKDACSHFKALNVSTIKNTREIQLRLKPNETLKIRTR